MTPWTVARQTLCPWDAPGKNTEVGCCFLLQGPLQLRGWTHVPCVSCIDRRILYHLSHWGSPFIMLLLFKSKSQYSRKLEVFKFLSHERSHDVSPFLHLMGLNVPGASEETWSERMRAPCVHGSAVPSSQAWKPPHVHWQMGGERRCGHVSSAVLLSVKKNEITPNVQHGWTWRLSYWATYVRQRSRNTFCHHLYVESKKSWYKCSYLQKRKGLTDLENEFMVARGKGWGG